MATVKDVVGNLVHEGDYVCWPGGRGKVSRIAPIIERGPYEGGTRVTVFHEIDFALPPGHKCIPEIQLVVPSDEEKKKDARLKEGRPAEPSFLETK